MSRQQIEEKGPPMHLFRFTAPQRGSRCVVETKSGRRVLATYQRPQFVDADGNTVSDVVKWTWATEATG